MRNVLAGTELNQGSMSLDYCTRRLEIKARPDYPPHGGRAVRWCMNLTLSWTGNLHSATSTLFLFCNLEQVNDFHASESQELSLSNKNTHLSSLSPSGGVQIVVIKAV